MEKDGENTVYVFGDTGNKGYVVASAEDIAILMLGYSDTGVTPPAISLPPSADNIANPQPQPENANILPLGNAESPRAFGIFDFFRIFA